MKPRDPSKYDYDEVDAPSHGGGDRNGIVMSFRTLKKVAPSHGGVD